MSKSARTEPTVIVLRDEVSLAEVLAYAVQAQWTQRAETPRAHLVLASRQWIDPQGVEIVYVADHPGGTHWLRVHAPDGSAGPAAIEAAVGALRAALPHHTEEELLSTVLDGDHPDPVACVRAASKLAAIRPVNTDPRHLATIERLLGHPETAVRRAGIRSVYGCNWLALRGIVRRQWAREQRLKPQLEHLERYVSGDDPG